MIRPTIINGGDIIVRDRADIRAVGTEPFGKRFCVWLLCAGERILIANYPSREEAKAYVAEVCKQAGIEIDNPQEATAQ